MRFLVHHLLRDAARRYPDRTAVVDEDRSMTYAELDEASSALAQQLEDLGVGKGDRVGLYLVKSLESVIGVYAVIKAGGAYVPFDPDAPTTRLAYIAGNCGIRCLLTGVERLDHVAALVAAGAALETAIVMNGECGQTQPSAVNIVTARLDGASGGSPSVDVIDQDLAYILYTSGSTGDPKGVMLTHRNALAFIAWAAEEFALAPDDRLSSFAPLHFDLSVFDLYAAAYSGAAVVLVPPKTAVFPRQVVEFVAGNEISVWYVVPSVLTMATLRGGLSRGDLPSLRLILFAGEVFPSKYLSRLMGLLPHARFANLYGPTETNVCTWYDVPPLLDDDADPVPIGSAVANDEVFAVTDDGRLATSGEVGELYVRGATVMRGYWNDPERTAATLVPNPFDPMVRDPVYRTGDLVEVMPGACYRYIGRRDSQVKSRGYRIELGDVEQAINAHPAVIECAVVAVPDDVVTNRLVAFVVSDRSVDGRVLARFCQERVPRYMVPESFTLLPALPKTSTGKIDRRSLNLAAEEQGQT